MRSDIVVDDQKLCNVSIELIEIFTAMAIVEPFIDKGFVESLNLWVILRCSNPGIISLKFFLLASLVKIFLEFASVVGQYDGQIITSQIFKLIQKVSCDL